FLHFEIVVARAERAHLLALAMARTLRHRVGVSAGHRPALLDPVEILGPAIALADCPARTAFEHAIHLDLVECDFPPTAHAGRNRPEEAVCQRLFAAFQIT